MRRKTTIWGERWKKWYELGKRNRVSHNGIAAMLLAFHNELDDAHIYGSESCATSSEIRLRDLLEERRK